MKPFIKAILRILNRREKVQFFKIITLDLAIGILDIAFLAGLLLVINFYTTNSLVSYLRLPFQFRKNSLLLIGIFFILYSLKNWLGYWISGRQNRFFYGIASRLSKQNMQYYLESDYIKFVNVDSSVHIRKISQQPIEFSTYILTNIQLVLSQSILIFFTITGIFLYHTQLLLSLFLLLMPPVFLLAFLIKKKLKNLRAGIKTTSQMTLQYLKESLTGFIESKIFNKKDFFTARYFDYQKQLNENIASQQILQGLPSRLIEVFAVLGFLLLIAINNWAVNTHSIGLLDIGVFMAASYKIIPGIVKILNSTGQIKTYQFTLKDLLAIDEKIAEKNNTLPAVTIHSVKFNNVGFKYRHNQILNNVSFEIFPGDFVGISGESGIGKTTIINLILGFLDQDHGVISINHAPTNIIERQRYWSKTSYVKQQSFFINDSALKNISLSADGYDVAKLQHALSFSGMDRMLDQYPEGINTIITENGKNISGGQRQRLMLARALYHDFDMLILDEPFSEIDEAAERLILMNLELLAKKGKIIIMITHNKASLSFCNKIIPLNGE